MRISGSAGLSPIRAIRAAIQTGLRTISDLEMEAIRERMELMMSVPELKAASLQQITDTIHTIAGLPF